MKKEHYSCKISFQEVKKCKIRHLFILSHPTNRALNTPKRLLLASAHGGVYKNYL